ncbi:peptide-methionine (S)-S-oxide reductase MsrA [Natranaeroarchaeum sulfidigenes]|uniref:peptide-methionine (S)-S-oxide reductase n=1 Tax=Natranaeroarchaeum sulfidigenes TaxID=2784880 RepID=A0A897MM62_9EURY|nr:peptide-methionine (S)-S-oxide reductase [Natranaeroarchaeum sulfidigenes]QSG01472.1 Peptide methionine sulfoxide reductase [Natranaeroarchaeum sulfidigenes]
MFSPDRLTTYDANAPTDTATATFGLGCFWGPDAAAGAIDGVVRTRVGYAGGTTLDPTYETIGDHTEVVQIEYDPNTTSFSDLLDWAFSQHHPPTQPDKRQYQNVVFTETSTQREQLRRFIDASEWTEAQIETRLERLDAFTLAEEYHQKFQLRGTRWITDAFEEAGYDTAAVRDSPAAAKLNAHAAGHDVTFPGLQQSYEPGR